MATVFAINTPRGYATNCLESFYEHFDLGALLFETASAALEFLQKHRPCLPTEIVPVDLSTYPPRSVLWRLGGSSLREKTLTGAEMYIEKAIEQETHIFFNSSPYEGTGIVYECLITDDRSAKVIQTHFWAYGYMSTRTGGWGSSYYLGAVEPKRDTTSGYYKLRGGHLWEGRG